MARNRFNRVVVLGANGTMGFRSGALFAAAGLDVVFLARTAEKAEAARHAAAKAVRSKVIERKIRAYSYRDGLATACAGADLIFEALGENAAIKQEFFAQIDRYRHPQSVVATVTSGLSISALAAEKSEDFQSHFLGLHFFNPPQVIVGTEIIPGIQTQPTVVEAIEDLCTKRLGRLTVRTFDTPGFAGNRIGFKVLNEAAQMAELYGPRYVDRLIGPYTGRSISPLATIDMVGWDVHRAIVDNVSETAKGDEAIDTYRLPASMRRLLEAGVLGDKSGSGFFRRESDGSRSCLDLSSGNYRPEVEIALPEDLDFIDEIAALHRIGRYRQGFSLLLRAPGESAQRVRRVLAGYISYAFCRVGEVCTQITTIDRIMAAGFNWAPPGALVDLIGIDQTIDLIHNAELTVPASLEKAASASERRSLFDDRAISVGKYFSGDNVGN